MSFWNWKKRARQRFESWFAVVAFAMVSLQATPAFALDSLEMEGDSKVSELGAFTSLFVTGAEIAEDYVFPVMAIVALGSSFWQLYSRRDYGQFAIGLIAAIGLAGMSFFMESIVTAFAS